MKKLILEYLSVFIFLLMLLSPFTVLFTVQASTVHLESVQSNQVVSEQFTSDGGYPYSSRFHPVEFYGTYSRYYPFRATLINDPFSLDFYEDIDQVKTLAAMFHAMNMKVIIYRPFSSLSEDEAFLDYWNLSLQDVAPMDLNGTYWVALPYNIGYEGREAWRSFFIRFLRILFDAGIDGIEFDGGDGLVQLGSFDPETMQKFNQYLASKYTPQELKEKFNITDISSFDFRQYLRDLGYHHCSYVVDEDVIIAHPGPDGPKDNKYAMALWEEFKTFNLKMLVEFYKLIMDNVRQWEEETGREFYISTRASTYPLDLPVLQYVDGVNWEYCWVNYPNRTAGKDFRVVQSLGKTFNPWITPWSSLESTGFTEWFIAGWNKTADPEEQYLGLSEIIVYGGRIPISDGVNQSHFAQFIKLVQENPQLFGQNQFGEIALIYPVATAINLRKLNITSIVEKGNFDSYEGTYYLLADSHRTFDIIVFGDNIWVNITQPLSKLLKYKAVVLPEALCLTDDQVELLEQYLENGGIIIGLGDIALYNEYGEPVDRDFSKYFDGQVHQVGNGLIISIKNISPSKYLIYRINYEPRANQILDEFRKIIDTYLPREVWTDLSPRAHIYRFFNYNEKTMIFHIINFNYDFEADKVIRTYNVSFNFTLPSQLKGEKLSVWVYSEDYPDGIQVSYVETDEYISITIPKVSVLTSIEVRPYFENPKPIVVNQPTVLSNEILVLNRSLIINSSLTILNSQIKVKGGVKPIKIEVLPGGSLIILNSIISKEAGGYYIVAKKGSSVFINGSDISGAGVFGLLERGGICIETEGAVILNSKIHNNYDFGVLLVNANHSLIGNSIFYDNVVGIALVNSSHVDLFNNIIKGNYAGIVLNSPDISLRELVKMYKRGIVPPRGPEKISISNSHLLGNKLLDIVASGCNFVSIVGSECSSASTINILSYQSIIKVCNSSIHSGWIGIMLYQSPINTIIGNRIYNHTRIGLKIYECCSMGILYWVHLEPIGAVSDEGDTRIIGNYIENNTYGIYMDFEGGPSGYFNRLIKISKNMISHNNVGVYVNRVVGYIFQNNFIENEVHARGGDDPCDIKFYLNTSKRVGNYWDNHVSAEPYEVFSGYYDYYPLIKPVQIPTITDYEGPLIRVENIRVIDFNETHVVIKFDLYASDQSYLGAPDFIGYFGVVALLGPHLTGREFAWNGFAAGLPGPEGRTKSFSLHDYTFLLGYTWDMKPVPFPREWVENASLRIYVTDMWGNWNKYDPSAPYIKVIYKTPDVAYQDSPVNLYIRVSGWSKLSKVQVSYFDGSTWNTVDAVFDDTTHLYYAVITPQKGGVTLEYRVYAENIYGKSSTYTGKFYVQEKEVPESEVSKVPTSITISIESKEVIVGEEIVIKGSINPPISTVITLTIKKPDGTVEVRNVTTSSDGNFSLKIKLDMEGKWVFTAGFPGDQQYEASVSVPTSVDVKPSSTTPISTTPTSTGAKAEEEHVTPLFYIIIATTAVVIVIIIILIAIRRR